MFENWISAFQLGAALSFVLGAYGSHRQPREEQLETWADEAVGQIAELRHRDGGVVKRQVPDGVLLNNSGWAAMSTTDLNDYRRDVTTRYYNTIETYKSNDRRRQILLWANGVFSVVALLVASAFPLFELPSFVGATAATVLISIPITCMFWVWREDMALASEANPSDPEAMKERVRKRNFRSKPARGQMFHVFNEIRRRLRESDKSE